MAPSAPHTPLSDEQDPHTLGDQYHELQQGDVAHAEEEVGQAAERHWRRRGQFNRNTSLNSQPGVGIDYIGFKDGFFAPFVCKNRDAVLLMMALFLDSAHLGSASTMRDEES